MTNKRKGNTMADSMYNNLKAKQAAEQVSPEAGMGMMPAAETGMGMDMGMDMGMGGEMPMMEEPMPEFSEEEMAAMSEEGRGGDVTMAHLTPGELVIPASILEDPEVMKTLEDVFDSFDMDMERYVVGSEANSINPDTGYPEFFDQGEAMKQQIQRQTVSWQQMEVAETLARARERRMAEESQLNREASRTAAADAWNRQRAAQRQAQQRAATANRFADAQRMKKQQASLRLASERRDFEKIQVAKQDRKRELVQRGKTLTAGAGAEAASTAAKKPGRQKAVNRSARRTAPARSYTTPGSGAGRYTASGKRPV